MSPRFDAADKEYDVNRAEIEIRGMTCDDCARHVERALRRAGAVEASVDWRAGRAVVTEGDVDEAALDKALAGSRYTVESVRRRTSGARVEGDRARHDYDLAVVGSGGAAFA